MDYENIIMDFFVQKGRADGIDVNTNLFAGGYVDSMFALEIIVYLEDTFKIRINNKDITEENFSTISNISRVVSAYVPR